MNSPKVCFVSADFPPKGGGLSVAAKRVSSFLVSEGWTVHVVTESTGERSAREEDGAMVHRFPLDYGRNESMFEYRQLVRTLDRQVGFDIFHGFFLTDAHICVGAAQAPGMARRPVIASIRGGDSNGLALSPYFQTQFVRAIAKSSWLTSVNETYLRDMGRHVDVRGKSSVIRNGVRPTPHRWSVERLAEGVVGTSGQFRREKDIPLLVRGYQGVGREWRKALRLVGGFADERERQWTETLIEEFGLRDEVTVTGYLPHGEVAAEVGRLSVYVQTSAHEGMPNALLEAAAAGVPIVATAAEGVREIVEDGVDGLLVPHGMPGLLSWAIERVLRSQVLAVGLSEGARRMAERFSVERERGEWVGLYRRLMGVG